MTKGCTKLKENSMSIGFTEILLILVVVLLLFGSKRIPELAKAMGKAAYEFKNAKETLKKEARELSENAQKAAEAEALKDDEKVRG